MNAIRVLNPTLTRVGMREIFNASDDGLQTKITHIAFGNRRYSPVGDETSLRNEIVRIPVLGGKYLSDFVIEMVSLLDHNQVFEVAELGVYLEDGTLLAVWSDPQTPLSTSTPGVPTVISYVLGISQLPAGVLNISGDVDLTLFFGTEFAKLGASILANSELIRSLLNKVSELEEVAKVTTLTAQKVDALQAPIIGTRDRVAALEQG